MSSNPPPLALCAICGFAHKVDLPHKVDAPLYQFGFSAENGRPPTWKDAIAHCEPHVQQEWERVLRARGAWTEPDPNYVPPVADDDEPGLY